MTLTVLYRNNFASSISHALHFTHAHNCCTSTINVISTLQLGRYNSLHSYRLSACYTAAAWELINQGNTLLPKLLDKAYAMWLA